MMSSEQLERQTEQSRAEVEMTIDELRARLTPGQLIDEVLSYTRDGGRQFTANLGRQVTDNPLPVVLMGAGLAWFLLGRNTTSSNGNGFNPEGMSYDSRSGMGGLGDAASKAGDAVQGAFGGVRHAAESAGSAVSDTAQKLGETASSAYHTASSKASDLANSATAFEQKTMRMARDLLVQAKDQPLVIVGLGLAIGAVIGAVIPETDIENRAMGDIADDVKRDAKHVASEQFDKAKDVAQRFVEETANGHGNGSQPAGDAVERNHFG